MAAASGLPENGSAAAPTSSEAANPPLNPATEASAPAPAVEKWPGWPGHCVFRLIVPVTKVGGIIGRKGDLIKKLCEETRARVRVLDGPATSPDRIVLISGKEEPEAPSSPAVDAIIRVFKRVNGLPESNAEEIPPGAAGSAFCSARLLVASTQAMSLIGKQGSTIKSIQESSGASVRVLSGDETPSYAGPDERIVELQGEALKVARALESVVGHLRKFLVDHTIIPLFEKAPDSIAPQERPVEAWPDKASLLSASQTGSITDYPFGLRREPLFLDRESQLESRLAPPSLSAYGQDPGLSSLRPMGMGRAGAPFVTQIAQTMQIPLTYAEDIIGTGGSNIAYIRRSSGATITVQESRGFPDEITVEIKGTTSQVQVAQEVIQEFISNHKEPPNMSSYERVDADYRSSYGQLSNTPNYPPSLLPPQQPYGGYGGGPGVDGGYSSFRL